MAKQQGNAEDVADMFDDAQSAPAAPRYGNIDPELDPIPGQPPVSAAVEQEPEPVEAEPEAPAADPTAERLAALERELKDKSREMEFVKAALTSPPAAYVQPAPSQAPPEQPLPFTITEHDVATILAGGQQAAALMQGALTLAYQRAREDAVNQVRNEYVQLRTNETHAQDLGRLFYQNAPELAAYPDIVVAQAQAVKAQYPTANEATLLPEIERRTRARLTQMGITPQKAGAAPAARPRIKPAAVGDGGAARRRGGGGGPSSRTEREVMKDFTDWMQ